MEEILRTKNLRNKIVIAEVVRINGMVQTVLYEEGEEAHAFGDSFDNVVLLAENDELGFFESL